MKILVLGAGRMGLGAAFDLVHNFPGVESVRIADLDVAKAEEDASRVGTNRINACRIDVADQDAVRKLMEPHEAAISCVNY